MKNRLLLLLPLFASCDVNTKKEAGSDLNNRALKIFHHNTDNKDSLQLALKMLDTAITINSRNSVYYANKLNVLHRLCSDSALVFSTLEKLERTSKDKNSVLLFRAHSLENLGHYSEANILYEKIYYGYNLLEKKYPDSIYIKTGKLFVMQFLQDSTVVAEAYSKLKAQYPHDEQVQSFEESLTAFDRKEWINNFCSTPSGK